MSIDDEGTIEGICEKASTAAHLPMGTTRDALAPRRLRAAPAPRLGMKRWTWTIKWEPRDIWVGLFWDRRADGLHIYVCLVPLVVIHGVRA